MPYLASDAHDKTRKANTGTRSRQWVAVYESSRERGDDEGTAITKANGVVKKHYRKRVKSSGPPRDRRPEEMKAASFKEAGASPEDLRRQLLGQRPVDERTIAEMIVSRKRGKKGKEKKASYQHRRRISTGKVPKTPLSELQDLRATLLTQERRMTSEGGKSPVGVSAKKVWKKHTRRGGRSPEVRESLRRSLTFHRPAGDPEGVKTVQFRTDAAKKPKAKAKPKKPKR